MEVEALTDLCSSQVTSRAKITLGSQSTGGEICSHIPGCQDDRKSHGYLAHVPHS
jgi:hypothetical protein